MIPRDIEFDGDEEEDNGDEEDDRGRGLGRGDDLGLLFPFLGNDKVSCFDPFEEGEDEGDCNRDDSDDGDDDSSDCLNGRGLGRGEEVGLVVLFLFGDKLRL